jgi:Fe-S-cluster containining protein
VDYTKYLVISALAVDTGGGACTALSDNRCSIHARRPLGCRSVPLHYSRPLATAEADLAAFVATPGHLCDTSESAGVVLSDGRIVDPDLAAARSEAIATAGRDRRWAEAIVQRMKARASDDLPQLEDIEGSAAFAAATTSMRVAWQIATDAALMTTDDYKSLAGLQLDVIDRELASNRCSPDARETLMQMRSEYRRDRDGGAMLQRRSI